LIEATQKKASFLNEAVRALKLDNVEIICERGESVTNLSADTVISRAFGTLNYLVTTSRHMVPKGGLFLAMKGKINPDEIRGLISGFSVLQIQEIEVPYLEATRHLVFIKKT
jgi:16S rRNA (guanine527-N7)-methyltransferase